MEKQIILTEYLDGIQWLVMRGNEVLGMGYENDMFNAFKTANSVYNKLKEPH